MREKAFNLVYFTWCISHDTFIPNVLSFLYLYCEEGGDFLTNQTQQDDTQLVFLCIMVALA